MKRRFRLYRRENGIYYLVNKATGQRESLETKDRNAADRLLHARNEAAQQPALNLQIARAYLAGSDSAISTRTWQNALDALAETKEAQTKERWLRAGKEAPFDLIRNKTIIETQGDQILEVLRQGSVSTNVYLRRLHNFCLDMGWLPWPLVPKRQWPSVRFKEKRAITFEEHLKIVDREQNPERKAFYQLAWHLGASQSDLAHLRAEDVDWSDRVISFFRMKTKRRGCLPPKVRFEKAVAEILSSLPATGPLFPYLRSVRAGDRATEFKQRCAGLGIQGVTLHSYRYAWAKRAREAGYPVRFAMENLGHNSKAVHMAYATKAEVLVPALEKYERKHAKEKVVKVKFGS